MRPPFPLLSVVVPVHQSAESLGHALEALGRSELPRHLWELVVVDDASTDASALVAAPHADLLVRLPGRPHGPAYARNRGVEVARGEVIVFLDADVCVHPDTLVRFARLFVGDPTVGAAFGSYDDRPAAPGIVSQYRNLLHHYVHQQNAGEAATFWAGCGAVRREVFLEAGMYDEWHFARPQIEDIELGHRMRDHGHRILLRPEIQVTHLKRWTVRDVLVGDFRNRGVPWMRLLIQRGEAVHSRALNLGTAERINTALVWLALALAGCAAYRGVPYLFVASALTLLLVAAVNRPLYGFFRRVRGVRFALAVLPLHLIYYVNNGLAVASGWLLHHLVGEPAPDPLVQAFAEVGVEMWPPVPNRSRASAWR